MNYYPKHYCGIFGIYGHPNAAELTYYGLYALQHRGQESAGIVTSDGKQFHAHKGMGLVPQVFKGDVLHDMVGPIAIGHTRYSTTGSSHLRNAQPLTVDCARGQIAIAHNGNLTNAAQLREELEAKGSIFQTTVDSEIILHLLAQPTQRGQRNNLVQSLHRIEGAYSLVIMTENELIGVRDPHGFRPLCLGRMDDAWVLASETCALDLINADLCATWSRGRLWSSTGTGSPACRRFRNTSAARSASLNTSISPGPTAPSPIATSIRCGSRWAASSRANSPSQADVVVPVPDSGNCAALGYSLESGIPFEMAFVRNHYVGRSFLQPSQLIRDFDVRVKLNLIEELVKGKRVIVVDDSIVRGTTCKTRVNNLKEAGAKEVHVLVSCPPHMNPCVYGIDFPDRNKLMAASHSPRGDSQVSQRRLALLPLAGRHGESDRSAGQFLLHGLLRRQLPGSLRSGDEQAHHRTPQRPAAWPGRRHGPGEGADQAALTEPKPAAAGSGNARCRGPAPGPQHGAR